MADDSNATRLRSLLFSDILGKRADIEQRKLVERYAHCLNFMPIEDLMISAGAWDHAVTINVPPELVFAHPTILTERPTTSLYYRGMALLSLKRVAQAGVAVTSWEDGTRKTRISKDKAQEAARIYNAIISSIIEGTTDWSLDNGYRNILATMGITLDGMFRNEIGDVAEALIKSRIVVWLKDRNLIAPEEPPDRVYLLPEDTLMRYGSEPDISFVRGNNLIATVEIKGGTDPAGALERLGAMTKSFEETPPGCVNFLVAGVITPEMQARLDDIGVVRVYLLDELAKDGERWDHFTNEVFHHTVRVV